MSRPESVQDSIFPLVTDPLTPSALSVSHNRGRRVSFG
uniref:Uncharacterized protein n=1 Tax=Heterorhabditis bacteriophora TaxID=37862 RepID=A0A1I7W7X4_HETBA